MNTEAVETLFIVIRIATATRMALERADHARATKGFDNALSLFEKICRRHFSDSPDREDKRRLAVEVFEAAAKIVNGEIPV